MARQSRTSVKWRDARHEKDSRSAGPLGQGWPHEMRDKARDVIKVIVQGTPELLATLRTEERFEKEMPPLLPEEFDQLRKNVLDAGEVYEPLITWDSVIIDGHNRLKIIREKPDLVWRVCEMDFADEWAALDCMYGAQLGQRNLTDAQRTLLIGRQAIARQKKNGGDRRSLTERYASDSRMESEKPTGGATAEIAKKHNVGIGTVERAKKFACGYDKLETASPEAAAKVLKGEAKVPKQTIRQLAKAEPEEVERVAKAIERGEKVQTKKPETGQPVFNTYPAMELVAPPQLFESEPYNMNDLLEEVEVNGEDYIRSLRMLLATRFPQFDNKDNRTRLKNAISVIEEKFRILKGEY